MKEQTLFFFLVLRGLLYVPSPLMLSCMGLRFLSKVLLVSSEVELFQFRRQPC